MHHHTITDNPDFPAYTALTAASGHPVSPGLQGTETLIDPPAQPPQKSSADQGILRGDPQGKPFLRGWARRTET